MDNETKMMLLKHVDSYWDILPSEIKEIILKFKQSQELIEWRESPESRELCFDIETYGQLRQKWFIGPIQCKPRLAKKCYCRPRCTYMVIYGHYWDLNGHRQQVFLDFFLDSAIHHCDHVKSALFYQMNLDHTLSVCSM